MKNPSPAIVWFRRDLRLADNPALDHAVRSHAEVIPVFVWAPEEEYPWAPGGASCWWLHHSLQALASQLAARGSRLILRQGPSGEVLSRVAGETGASAIYWNRCYEPAAIARDSQVKQRLREAGITAESFPGNLLFEPWNIKNTSGGPFQVFTPFWRACEAAAGVTCVPSPERIGAPKQWPSTLHLTELGLLPTVDWTEGIRQSWIPGEEGGSVLLQTFARSGVDAYEANRDRPEIAGTSRLSPYLHFGEISPRQVWNATEAAPFRRQLAWREFAHHLLFHFPRTDQHPLRPQYERFPWQMNEAHFSAWTKGRTGYPLVDAGMRELWHTGWMHNRVRMIAASFLVKHLLIPWQEGAKWFWDTLVDADLANNTLGWQWIAGCGADAAPYFRIFNPVLQGQKFDPQGTYVRRWIPELRPIPEPWIHSPWEAPPQVRSSIDYPSPIVKHDEARKRALAALATLR